MPSGFHTWSQTAGTNASADSAINFAEGQAPSSVNDSMRAEMAVQAKWRDDNNGSLLTTGTATALVLTTNTVFTSLALLANQEFAFTMHATSGLTPTLNVDGLGAKILRNAVGVTLPTGALLIGSIYHASYNNVTGEFLLHGQEASEAFPVIPLGACIPYFGTTAPNAYFAIPLGQAISRTTYATLFVLFGTTYGVGDGSTTFNLPDMGGRVPAGKEATATRLTTAGGGIDGGTLGAVGGAQNVTLITANLPAYTPAGTLSAITSTVSDIPRGALSTRPNTGGPLTTIDATGVQAISSTGTFTGTAQGGTSTAVKDVQPTIICNYIMRVI